MIMAVATILLSNVNQLASTASCQKGSFFGLAPWYKYLKLDANCNVLDFQLLGANSSLLLIALAIIDDLLRVAGIVAVGFVIYGGFKYISSQGNPDQTAAAQKSIINALIGLALSIVAVAVVSFIGRSLAVK